MLARACRAITIVLLLALAACSSRAANKPTPKATKPTASHAPNPYFAARFTTTINATSFGQDPTYTADGRVLHAEPDRFGVKQVFVSALDGTNRSCLTCTLGGPNGFPMERPQGDWVLFCSWHGNRVTYGQACLGGFGSDMWLVRPDGTGMTRLTAEGDSFEPAGIPFDNYHPAWSPDGQHITWTHVSYEPASAGGTQWTILMADVDLASATPRLTNVRVIAPAGNTAYETQAWAPDGSGLLYTSLVGTTVQAGWLNSELFFLRLHGNGATPEHPQVTQLTDNSPAWDEQAVFTPDMKDVLFMSSRDTPSWYETTVKLARDRRFMPAQQNETAGPMFIRTIIDPAFRTDLYELDLGTHAIRRLTNLGNVVPEFTFDASGRHVLWTEGLKPKLTMIGTFDLGPSTARRVATPVAPDPRWAGAHGIDPDTATALPATPPSPTLPQEVIDGAALLDRQLAQLQRAR